MPLKVDSHGGLVRLLHPKKAAALGPLAFYRVHVPNHAAIKKPFTVLVAKRVPWNLPWTDKADIVPLANDHVKFENMKRR